MKHYHSFLLNILNERQYRTGRNHVSEVDFFRFMLPLIDYSNEDFYNGGILLGLL